MSTLSQFTGGGVTRTIVNAFSSGGVSSGNVPANVGTNMGREVLSGALTANTLKDIVSVTGSGQMELITAYAKNATSRTIRLVVVVDGATVFDATSNAVTGNGNGLVAVGQALSGGGVARSAPVRFNSSCVIRVASSLSETDLVAIGYSLV